MAHAAPNRSIAPRTITPRSWQKHVEHLSDQQELLYASDSYALLLIFQAMDAAGKDGAIAM